MVPTFTSLTASMSTADQDAYDTASITPTANRLLVAYVLNSHATAPQTPTLSGGGVSTWTQVITQTQTNGMRLTAFRALTGASPTSGAVTIDFDSNVQSGCVWGVVEVTDCVLTGTNGSDAIAQSKSNAPASGATNSTVQFDNAYGDDDNRALYCAGIGDQRTTTPITGFSAVASALGSSPSRTLSIVAGRGSDLLCGVTWTSNSVRIGMAIEIVGASAASGPGTIVIPRMSIRGFNRWAN